MSSDLLVCGLGPAGRALAHRALAHGLSVTTVDPNPDRRWTATYAAWADELPDWLPPETIATAVDNPVAWALRRIELHRRYVVLDTPALQDTLNLSGARIITGRVADIPRPHRNRGESARLLTGEVLTATRVIDARGLSRTPARAEQTAYGLIIDRDRCADTETVFMDWRLDNGAAATDPRSFLYSVPLDAHSMLLEETCLAGRPALDLAELRTRLHHRLRSRAIAFTEADAVERVRFPVEGGTPNRRTFGAAGGFTHPATGYSVAAALRTADAVATGSAVRSPAARAVHTLRRAGLRALLALPPQDLPLFFDAFFTLPAARQRAYLSGRDDLPGTAAAMSALFAALPWRLRRTLATATLGTAPRSM